ncbi:MAG: GntR family transcriptional regulator [Spirochaetota bacterium]
MIYSDTARPSQVAIKKISAEKESSLAQSKNLSVEIADILMERIIRSELRPGERILEAKVSKELGVSQSSLREALRVLEQNGLVRVTPRRGTYVTEITHDDIIILYDILSELYILLARQALKRRGSQDMAVFLASCEDFERSAEKAGCEDFYTAMFDIVQFALGIIQSGILTKVTVDLLPTKRRIEYRTLTARKDDMSSLVKYLHAMKAQIAKGNIAGLEKTIRAFMRDEKDTAVRIFGKTG